ENMHLFYVDNPIGFVAVLAVILFFTKTIGLGFRHFGLPEVLGFIIAGILIGPAIFGDLCGFTIIGFEGNDYYSLLEISSDSKGLGIFSKIGVLFLMFCAGLETNVKELKNTGLASFLIALAGVCVPLLLGFVISLPFSNIGLGVNNIYRCVFIGTILTATSVAITVSVLKELGKMNTKLGTTIVSAAIIDDVIGIVLLSVVTGLAKSGSEPAANKFEAFKATPYGTVIMIAAFFIVAVALGFVAIKVFKWMDKRWASTHRISMYSLVMCFGYSFLAEEVFGVADITGAFLAGAVLSTVRRASRFIDQQVDVDTYTIFAPVFFANIGISSITFKNFSPAILLFAFVAVIAGLVGKIIGCGAVCKAFKYSWRESAIGGVGMMARGEVALIVTSTAIGAGVPGEFMIMTVFLILVSSILTPILLKVLYKGIPSATQVPLIDPDD
ncbi:MAG: cation:proton antiporter, partial [Clostridia bacterium]|nr:cation:proton antiporter [Clostridia bacterium]